MNHLAKTFHFNNGVRGRPGRLTRQALMSQQLGHQLLTLIVPPMIHLAKTFHFYNGARGLPGRLTRQAVMFPPPGLG